MSNHQDEKDGIEPGKRTSEAGDESPHQRKIHVTGIMKLPSVGV